MTGSLTQEYLKTRLDYDPSTGFAVRKNGPRRGKRDGCVFSDGYRNISIRGHMIELHRLAWLWAHGVLPCQIDHKNGEPGQDWIENLRPANQSQNRANSRVRSDSKSGVKGVVWCKDHKKWRVLIGPRGSVKHCGYFDSLHLAAEEPAKASKDIFGEFARIS